MSGNIKEWIWGGSSMTRYTKDPLIDPSVSTLISHEPRMQGGFRRMEVGIRGGSVSRARLSDELMVGTRMSSWPWEGSCFSNEYEGFRLVKTFSKY